MIPGPRASDQAAEPQDHGALVLAHDLDARRSTSNSADDQGRADETETEHAQTCTSTADRGRRNASAARDVVAAAADTG